jgi:hypothetical protein
MTTLTIHDPSAELFAPLRNINDEQKAWLDEVRQAANMLLVRFEALPDSRRKSIAITKLEESILFANKCATFGR